MIEIYGRVFRRQEHQRPWWWTTLVVLGILIGLAWATFTCFCLGKAAMWCIESQAPQRQLPAVRLAGLVLGIIALSLAVSYWRKRLFLDAPIRDLAATPGSSWQVLKIALRLKWWHVISVPVVLLSIALMPWYLKAANQLAALFAWASTDDSRWTVPADLLQFLNWPLAFGASVVTVMLLYGVFSATAIAIGFALSATGLGGVGPRSLTVSQLFHYAVSLAVGIGVVAVVTTMAYWTSIDRVPPQPEWWHMGRWCDAVLAGNHPLSDWLRGFPGVAIGEFLQGLAFTERSVAPSWFAVLAWGAAATGLAAVCFRAGYSFKARSGFEREMASVVPADAGRTERRSFDPDGVNGPLEGLLIAWLGRMGRAILRLVSANAQSGAIDQILYRTVLAIACCALLGQAAMWLVPAGLSAVLIIYDIVLSQQDLETIRSVVAVTFLIALAVYCLVAWGGPKMWQTGAKAYSRDEQAESAAGSWGLLFKRRRTATRGDRRHPLVEIYAVGFSDAVLVPTLYAGFWIAASGAAVGVTGLLFDVTAEWLGWAVAIGVPALWQLSFLSYISSITNYWTHYSRSLLLQIFHALWMGVLVTAGGMACLALIVILCRRAYDAGYPPYIPWLGALNILAVTDVAFYMTVRWLYVRRRFDAEFRNPAAWG